MAKINTPVLVGGGLLGVYALYKMFGGSTSKLNPSTPTTTAVPTGAVLDYNAQVITIGPDRDLSLLVANLQADGISVANSSIGGNLLNGFVSTLELSAQQVPLTLQVVVQNSGYGKADDLKSVIDHEVYVATGSLPVSSSINFDKSQAPPSTSTKQTSILSSLGLSGIFSSLSTLGTGTIIGIVLALAGITTVFIVSREA